MSAEKKRILPFSKKPLEHSVSLVCASDKSLTHRALMFAALARGTSTIERALFGEDCLSTLRCMQALGASAIINEDAGALVEVTSPGMHEFSRLPVMLDCGNSGTTSRLLLGLLSSTPGVNATFHGDQSLSSRPMGRVVDPLRHLGANISYLSDPGRLPTLVKGVPLKPGHITIDKASAQVKSALLLAGLNIEGTLSIDLPEGTRDHTERILINMGAKLSRDWSHGRERISLEGPFQPATGHYKIPSDPSSAAFFSVLGLLRPTGETVLHHVLDNPSRIGFLTVLERMTGGETITKRSGERGFVEPVMDIVIKGGGELHATDITPSEVPGLVDEIPILAVAAMFARGRSRFAGLHELRVKESDRLMKTGELIQKAGGDCRIEGDDLIINGPIAYVPFFTFDPVGDHRLAMAAAVLGRASHKGADVIDPGCVAVSFPNFFDLLDKVT